MLYRNKLLMKIDKEIVFFHRSSFSRCPITLIISRFQCLRTEKNLTTILYTTSSEIRIHPGHTHTRTHAHAHIFTTKARPVALKVWSQTTIISSCEILIEMQICRLHPRPTELETLEIYI